MFPDNTQANEFNDAVGKKDLSERDLVTAIHDEINISLITPSVGSKLIIKIVTQLKDPADTVIKEEIVGLAKDTILSDGTKSHIIMSTDDKVEVHTWDHDHITAQLPAGINTNMSVAFMVEISSANNSTTEKVQVNAPLILKIDAPVAHHNDHEDLKLSVIEVDACLVDIKKEIEEARAIINDLKAKGKDITEVEDEFNILVEEREECLAEKVSLENFLLKNADAASGIEEVSENLGSIIPEKDALTFSLDNAAKNLAASDAPSSASVATTSDKSKALDKVASLLDKSNDEADNIIKTIEELEAGEHVANPNKPNTYDSGSNDLVESRHIAGHNPDVNNSILLDDHDMHETYVV